MEVASGAKVVTNKNGEGNTDAGGSKFVTFSDFGDQPLYK